MLRVSAPLLGNVLAPFSSRLVPDVGLVVPQAWGLGTSWRIVTEALLRGCSLRSLWFAQRPECCIMGVFGKQ